MRFGPWPILSILFLLAVAGLSVQECQAQEPFEEGVAYFEAGWYDSAAIHFQQALRQDPSNSAIRYNLALSWFESGNVADALPEIEAFLERYPEDPVATMNYGLMLFALGNYELAAGQFGEVLNEEAYVSRATCYKALCDYAMGNYDEAISSLESCEVDSSMAELLSGIRGNAALVTEDYISAESFLSQAIVRKPDHAPYYLNRGIAHYHLTHYEKAIGDFTVCLALDSNISKAYIYRGLSEEALGNPQAAVQDLKQGNTETSQQEGRLKWSKFLSRHWYALLLTLVLLFILLISLLAMKKKKSAS
jgi:tetratricopeptide (TPR) repeat protein